MLLPARDVDAYHTHPHDVFQTRPQGGERPFGVSGHLNRLRVCVSGADDLAAPIGRGRAGAEDQIADAKRPRISDYWLPFLTRRLVLLFSHDLQRRQNSQTSALG